MFSLEFLVTSFVVVLVPGTGVVYAVSTGLIQGRRAAIFAALGGVAGIVPHLLATILGLAAVLHTSALAWQADALCAQTDPEAFFPEKGGSTRDAKRICTTCDVRDQCLEYALQNDERFGIWGGLSERERRKLKRAAG